MSRSHQSGGAPSQRMLRVAETVRHAVADALARGETGEPDLARRVVTVPEVRMSPDLKLATVYVVELGGGDPKPMLAALDRARKALRAEVAHKVNLKFAPEIRFRHDDAFAQGDRIEALLRSPQVARDLAPRDPDPAPGSDD